MCVCVLASVCVCVGIAKQFALKHRNSGNKDVQGNNDNNNDNNLKMLRICFQFLCALPVLFFRVQ